MKRWLSLAFGCMLAAMLASCGSQSAAVSSLPAGSSADTTATNSAQPNATASKKLKHIIVVIQENRSVDNLFNGFCISGGPCADTVTADPVSGTPLQQESLAAPFDPFHDRSQFVVEYDNGKMDGFPKAQTICNKQQAACSYTVFDYAPASETGIYRQLATVDGVLADETFQTEQGPSFPSHFYAIAGQSGAYDPPHLAIDGGSGTCGAPKQVRTLDMTAPYPGKAGPSISSCQDFRTIMDLLVKHGHSWHYYSNTSSSFWSGTQSIQHLYNSSNFTAPSTQFLTDVANGQLADVTFVMPWDYTVSDHPGTVTDPYAGPNWVGQVVNAVGQSPFWNDSAVLIYWDDWGGFFDHVKPPVPSGAPSWMGNPDPFEYAFRVPLIVVSPYAKIGTIDHTSRSFVSTLRLIESTFKVGTLLTTDQYEPDALDPAFDFTQKPLKYTPVGGSAARPFAHLHPTTHSTPPPGDGD